MLLGNGDGTFQDQVQYAAGEAPVALVAGDFNGDGRTDLAVANYYSSNDVSVLLGNGDGTFRDQMTYSVGYGPNALVAGDFNGDGRTDLAVANYE
ncbi:MAG: VCBS repeat-containing protein, partial [Isosphaeraceae bacterium]